MRSATDFLPPVMSTLTNLDTSWLPNFGSGSILRLGTSLRLGMVLFLNLLSFFRALSTVFRAGLLTIFHASCIQAAAHHVVTHTWQILYTTTTQQHNRVLLQIVAFAADVANHFIAVGQAHFGNFTQSRVWLLWRSGIHTGTYTAFLW